MGTQQMVEEFHEKFGLPVGAEPHFLSPARRRLRNALILEEAEELSEALDEGTLTDVADALGDLLYVVYGTAVEVGMQMGPIVREIHRSNMTKLDARGNPIFRDDGKVMKSFLFQEPKLGPIVNAQQITPL